MDNAQRLSEMLDGVYKLPPVVVDGDDRDTGRLILLALYEVLPEDATVGDVEDLLLNALWWVRLWASAGKAKKILEADS